MQSHSGQHKLLELLLFPHRKCGGLWWWAEGESIIYSSHLHLNKVKRLQSFTLKTAFTKLPQATFQKLDARASVPTLKDREDFVTAWH